jgi:dihydroorotate dehydrogenase electron transfer subunit
VGPLPAAVAYRIHPAGADRVSVAIKAVGTGTRALVDAKAGDSLRALGPLGTPEKVPEGVRHVVLLAGGVGFAPLYAIALQCHWRHVPADFLVGARTRDHLFPWPDDADRFIAPEFHDLDLRLRAVTEADDGKYATDLLSEHLGSVDGRDTDLVYACGPGPMMARAVAICAEARVDCRVFLEKRMECSIGVCMSCVCRYRGDDGEWRNARVCREGSVFDSARIAW